MIQIIEILSKPPLFWNTDFDHLAANLPVVIAIRLL